MIELLLLFGLEVAEHAADLPEEAPTHEAADEMEPDLPPILEDIAWCESRGKWHGQDGDIRGTAPRSSASGRWRFIDSTWQYVWTGYLGEQPPTERAKHAAPEQQIRAAIALYEREGTTPWNASRGCWG